MRFGLVPRGPLRPLRPSPFGIPTPSSPGDLRLPSCSSPRLACAKTSLPMRPAIALTFAAFSLWGFAQLLASTTVYRWATVNATLQYAALAAILIAGYSAFETERSRSLFRRALMWFGLSLSVLGVLCYLTSPGQILWIFPSDYPDNWGVFPSRNNFAQFLELCFPVALYEMACARRSWTAALAAAAMLAAGLASASRAGAVLLLAEAFLAPILLRRKGARPLWDRPLDPLRRPCRRVHAARRRRNSVEPFRPTRSFQISA